VATVSGLEMYGKIVVHSALSGQGTHTRPPSLEPQALVP